LRVVSPNALRPIEDLLPILYPGVRLSYGLIQRGLVILLYTSCRLPGLGKVGWWRGRAKRGAGRWAICDDMVDRPIHH
jgi:hypothetical protein